MLRYLATALALAATLSAVPALAAKKSTKYPPAPKCAECLKVPEGTVAIATRYNWKRLHAMYKPGRNPEPLAQVLEGCGNRAQSVYGTSSYLYGAGYGFTDAIDDARNCFARHGWQFLGWRQANGKITPYPHYDPRLDY